MNLSLHFTLAEFTDSDLAVRHGIDNSLPEQLVAAARETCEMLERIRAFLSERAGREVPVYLSSGYRCLPLNRLLNSDDSSAHPKAGAGDFVAPAFGTPFEIAHALSPVVNDLGIGQLIHEYGRWVHAGTHEPDKVANRIITICRAGKYVGIQEVV